MGSSDRLKNMPIEDRNRLEKLLLEFDLKWAPEAIASAALGVRTGFEAQYQIQAIGELVKIDLQHSWKGDQGRRLEDYLQRFPMLGDEATLQIELLAAEYFARQRSGHNYKLEAYLERFPDHYQGLVDHVQMASEINSHPGNVQPEPADTGRLDATADTANLQMIDTSSLPREFGRYRLLKKLGAGAMGKVFLAHDGQLDRQVALKMPSFMGNRRGESIERFYREARTAARIQHRNICPIYDVGEIHGQHYISMGYVKGRTLADYIRPENLPPQRTSAMLIHRIARAMAEAHQSNVVHRDLKPANIMIDVKREPIIMDFGLAVDTESESRLTQSGLVVGTPAYMSPEQIRGENDEMGPASDVFSLGVIFYELLTGTLPFRGTIVQIVQKITSDDPARPSKLREEIDVELESICLTMMAKDRSTRFSRMEEVADSLKSYLKGNQKITNVSLEPVATANKDSTDSAPDSTDGKLGETDVLNAYFGTQTTGATDSASVDVSTVPSPSAAVSSTPDQTPVLATKRVIAYGIVVASLVLLSIASFRSWFPGSQVVRISFAEQLLFSDEIQVVLDGQPLAVVDRVQSMQLDPGRHRWELRRGDEILQGPTSFDVEPGVDAMVHVDLPEKPPATLEKDDSSEVVARKSNLRVGDGEGMFATLESAIDAAESGDVIELYASRVKLPSDAIKVLERPGMEFELIVRAANNKHPVVEMPSRSGMVFRNGKIKFEGLNFEITDPHRQQGSAVLVACDHSDLTFRSCTFLLARTGHATSLVRIQGTQPSNVVMENCFGRLIDGTSVLGRGNTEGTRSTLEIRNSLIVGAGSLVGALHPRNYGVDLSIQDCTFGCALMTYWADEAMPGQAFPDLSMQIARSIVLTPEQLIAYHTVGSDDPLADFLSTTQWNGSQNVWGAKFAIRTWNRLPGNSSLGDASVRDINADFGAWNQFWGSDVEKESQSADPPGHNYEWRHLLTSAPLRWDGAALAKRYGFVFDPTQPVGCNVSELDFATSQVTELRSPGILRVGSEEGDYETIESAIANALSGDVIEIHMDKISLEAGVSKLHAGSANRPLKLTIRAGPGYKPRLSLVEPGTWLSLENADLLVQGCEFETLQISGGKVGNRQFIKSADSKIRFDACDFRLRAEGKFNFGVITHRGENTIRFHDCFSAMRDGASWIKVRTSNAKIAFDNCLAVGNGRWAECWRQELGGPVAVEITIRNSTAICKCLLQILASESESQFDDCRFGFRLEDSLVLTRHLIGSNALRSRDWQTEFAPLVRWSGRDNVFASSSFMRLWDSTHPTQNSERNSYVMPASLDEWNRFWESGSERRSETLPPSAEIQAYLSRRFAPSSRPISEYSAMKLAEKLTTQSTIDATTGCDISRLLSTDRNISDVQRVDQRTKRELSRIRREALRAADVSDQQWIEDLLRQLSELKPDKTGLESQYNETLEGVQISRDSLRSEQ